MATVSEQQSTDELRREAGKITEPDLEKLLERQKRVEEKVRSSGKLRRFSTDIQIMFSLIRDYWNGDYRQVPWKSVAAIAGAMLYVLNPLDLIPDMLLGAGFLDDAGVVALCLKWVESDLHRYAAWKELSDGEA